VTLLAIMTDGSFREQLSIVSLMILKEWIMLVGKQGSCDKCWAWCRKHDTKLATCSNCGAWHHRYDTRLVDIIVTNIKLTQINQLA